MKTIETQAWARAGLLGNPSDGYHGKTISISVRNFGARVALRPSKLLRIEPSPEDVNAYRDLAALVASVRRVGYYGGTRLLKAAIKIFFEYCEQAQISLADKNFAISYRSTIPRQVGLAGSSAIVTAAMRALMRFYQVAIPRETLPNLILAVETDELGITAGLQDRVIQVYEGCLFMNFGRELMAQRGYGRYERIDPALLPPLYLAYRTALGKVSGAALSDLHARFELGDAEATETLQEIAALAAEGRQAILRQDHRALHSLINRNFDLRQKIMAISAANLALVRTARDCGASAKFAGSGGAIIGTYRNEAMLARLRTAMRNIGAEVVVPRIA